MNFLILVSDSFRWDYLGCYGNAEVHTPSLDRFAKDALVFERAYLSSFPTIPARRDLLTGCYSSARSRWGPLPAGEPVLGEYLALGGYTSMMITDNPHLLGNGYHYDRGFGGFEWIRGQESDRWRTSPESPDPSFDRTRFHKAEQVYLQYLRNISDRRLEEEYFAPATMIEAGRWLERNYRRSNPWLLYVDTFDPHEPWDAPPWYEELYAPGYDGEHIRFPLHRDSGFLSAQELEHERAMYAAEVTMVDRWIGHLLDRLDDTGHRDDTTVIFLSDHGFLHGEHGFVGKCIFYQDDRVGLAWLPLWEELAHIPLIVRLPGGRRGRSRAIVQLTDVLPTIVELAALERPPGVHGRSFAKVLQGGRDHHLDVALSFPTLVEGAGRGACITATADAWSFVCAPYSPSGGPVVHVPEVLDGPGGLWPVWHPEDELYDLDADPGQGQNLAGERADVVAALREDVRARIRALGTADDIARVWGPPVRLD